MNNNKNNKSNNGIKEKNVLKVGMIQMEVIQGDVTANRAKAESLIRTAAAKGAKIITLPELWNCGYRLEELEKLAEYTDVSKSESMALLSHLAAEYGLYIFGGSIAEKKNGRYYNTAVVFNDKGEVIQKYRKTHLFQLGLHEPEYFTPGDEWSLVDTPWGRVGLVICYDLRFPELWRNLVLRGAKIIVCPAQWPTARLYSWRALNIARAIENEAFVISTNRTGEDDYLYPGNSLLIDPRGRLVADGGETEGVLLGELDLDLLADDAYRMGMIQERRPIIDEIDDTQI